MRHLWPKKRSRIGVSEKAQLAAWVLHQVITGVITDPKDAGRQLREAIGLNWSWLTAIQYLTGQEAIGALEALPSGAVYRGVSKRELLAVVVVAHDLAANIPPGGGRLSAGLFVNAFRREPGEADQEP